LDEATQQIRRLTDAQTTSAADVALMLEFLTKAQRGIVR